MSKVTRGFTEQRKKIIINDCLEKIGLPVGRSGECSELVREWLLDRANDPDYLKNITSHIRGAINASIEERAGNLKRLRKISEPSKEDEKELADTEKQLAVLMDARKSIIKDEGVVGEVYELFLAGTHLTHQALGERSQFTKPKVMMVDPDSLTNLKLERGFKEYIARNGFAHLSSKDDNNKLLHTMLIHMNIFLNFAAAKYVAKYEVTGEKKQEVMNQLKGISTEIIAAGSEEYYHAFQFGNKESAARLRQAMCDYYQTTDYEEAASRASAVYARMADILPDSEEACKINREFHDTNPVEVEANTFLVPIKARAPELAARYLERILVGHVRN